MRLALFRKMQRWLAYAAPMAVAASLLWHAAMADFARNVVLSNVALIVFVGTLEVSLFKRSRGLETAWRAKRVPATVGESPDDPVDVFSLDVAFVVLALFIALFSVFPRWL